MDLSWITLRRLAQAMPIVFALHVFEESLGFVQWFNERVEPDLTWGRFMTVTSVCFVVTVLIAAQLAVSRGRAIGYIASTWIAFLMMANGMLHIAASVIDVGYVPGLVTAVLLYLPYSVLTIGMIIVNCALPTFRVAMCASLASIPMFAQGWLVLSEGRSLI